MTKSLFKRSGGYFLGLVFSKATNLLLFIFVAKLLSPKNFGSIIYYSTILSLVTLLADFGTIQWYQKEKSIFNRTEIIVNKVLNARLVSLAISGIILSIYLLYSQRFNLFLNSLLLVSLIPESLLSLFDGYYLEQKKPRKISIKQIARSLTLVVFVLIFSKVLTLEIFAISLFAAAFLNMLWFVPWKYVLKFKLNFKSGLKTLRSSSKYAVLITTSYAYSRGDSIIIENTIGSSFLGIYSAAYRYLEGISLLPNALAQNLFHIAAKKDNLKFSQVVKIMTIMTVLGLIAGFGVYIFADVLTTQILGNDYSLAKNVLQVFSMVVVLFFINAPLSSIVQSSDQLKKFIPWGIGNTIGNIFLNIWLIPMYGIMAAAWIMFATEASGLFINLFFVKKIYRR